MHSVMRSITTTAQLQAALEASKQAPLFLFKHSTACSLSANAHAAVQRYLKTTAAPLPVYLVLVIENRPLSNEVATLFSVQHQSPQLLLIHQKKCLWHDSHRSLTTEKITTTAKQATEDPQEKQAG